ncbi:Lar family restriction alleviation protein [Oxalobacter vibrioformis]|uniref:Lar family restriction alleviation protein n=1 Tax=Oxalobacter vibrioformis TaxID=933080 RepID=UPI0038CD978B
MSEVVLKPCPCCGSEARYEYNDELDTHAVYCGNHRLCGVATTFWADAGDCIEAWNRRVTEVPEGYSVGCTKCQSFDGCNCWGR